MYVVQTYTQAKHSFTKDDKPKKNRNVTAATYLHNRISHGKGDQTAATHDITGKALKLCWAI